MIYSHANFHIHRATHDNEWVEWEDEEEWLIIKTPMSYNRVNLNMLVVIIFITLNTQSVNCVEQRICANGKYNNYR